MRQRFQTRAFLFFLLLLHSPNIFGGASGFFSKYNLGMSFEGSASFAVVSYDAPHNQGPLPENCVLSQDGAGLIHCNAYLVPDVQQSSYPNFFLDEPFKRQGWLYFDYGFTFSTVTYQGVLAPKPSSVISASNIQSNSQQKQSAPDQPLTRALLEMYGINWQGYLRFGLTPLILPDLLATVGLGIQTVVGRVKLFKQDSVQAVIQPEVFAELEAVLLRYKTGAFSVYVGTDEDLQSPTKITADHPSGTQLTNIHLGLYSASLGVKILFPF